MSLLNFRKINDFDINKYLKYRNLKLNLQNSVNIKKIDKLDHYIWWLNDCSRVSYMVTRDEKELYILHHTIKSMGNKKIIFPGYFVCGDKFNVLELLESIKWQNMTIDKIKGKKICVVIVPKKNIFSNSHTKYFKYKILNKNSNLYNQINKLKNFNRKFNIYVR